MKLINIKELLSNKIIQTTIITYTGLLIMLNIFIPYQMHKDAVELTTKEANAIINTMEITRNIYDSQLVAHIDKNKKEAYNHSFSASLDTLNTSMDDYNIRLYSDVPLGKNKEKTLSVTDNIILNELRNNTKNSAIHSQIEINDKLYLKVSKAQHLDRKTCIKCHTILNDFDSTNREWGTSEVRGVLELVLPISSIALNDIFVIQIIITISILTLMFISLGYYGFHLLKLEEDATIKNNKLTTSFSESLNQLNFENEQLENDLNGVYTEFGKYVIYSKTDLFGVITEVSNAFCEIAGYKREELIGKPHNIIRHPDMPKESFKDMWDTIEKNKIWRGEVKNLKKDGDIYWVTTIISPTYDNTGCKNGYSSIRYDITSKKMKELLALSNNLKYGNRRKKKRNSDID